MGLRRRRGAGYIAPNALPTENLILNLNAVNGTTWTDKVNNNNATISFPCLDLAIGEVITFADLTGVDLESSSSYEGTATIAKSGNTLLCSGAGTCYNVMLDNGAVLPLSGHLYSQDFSFDAVSTTGSFTDELQSTFDPEESYNLGIKSTADANTITALFTEDGVDFSYYKYTAIGGTSAKVEDTTSSGANITLATGDIITGLVIGTKSIDMSVDRNWTIADAENVILPENTAGFDVLGMPIVTYLGGNAIASYSRFTIPALTPDIPDRTNATYWDVDNLLVDYDATVGQERSYSPRMFTNGNEYPHSLMSDLYFLARLRSPDSAIEQLVGYLGLSNKIYTDVSSQEIVFDNRGV